MHDKASDGAVQLCMTSLEMFSVLVPHIANISRYDSIEQNTVGSSILLKS